MELTSHDGMVPKSAFLESTSMPSEYKSLNHGHEDLWIWMPVILHRTYSLPWESLQGVLYYLTRIICVLMIHVLHPVAESTVGQLHLELILAAHSGRMESR